MGKMKTENIKKTAGFKPNTEIENIYIEDIIKDFDNIRTKKDFTALYMQSDIRELAESIIQYGQLQPITVTPIDNKNYKIITGHRRFLACYYLYKGNFKDSNEKSIDTIKAIVTTNNYKDDLIEIQLIENIQREDLTDIELEKALKQLKETKNLTDDQLSKILNKSRVWVTNKLRAENVRRRTLTETDNLTTNEINELTSGIKNNLDIDTAIKEYNGQLNKTIQTARQINKNKKQTDNENVRRRTLIEPDIILDFNIKVDKQHNIVISCNDTELKELLQQTITDYYNKKDLSI